MKKQAVKEITGIRNRIREMRNMKAGDIQSHPLNPRLHSPEQQATIGGILSSVGIADALLAFPADGLGPKGDFTKLMAYDGHCRKDLDPDQVWPVLVTDLTRPEADAMLAMLDYTASLATIDPALAAALAVDAKASGIVSDESWAAWAEQLPKPEPPEIVEDEIPEVPAVPITKPGDLWLMGEHRLLCGDSTKAEDVARLMAGEKADAVVTDPPYGIGSLMHGGTWATKQDVQFEMMRQWDATNTQQFFDMIVATGVPAVVWGGNYFVTPASRCWLVWDKPEFPTMSSAELAWTNLDRNTKRIECPRTHQSDGAKEHATQKPVRVMAWSLEFVPEGIVYDPFLGSGTTIIAAHQLGRKCYGLEISPAYCDVSVSRWEKLTGKRAVLASR